MTWPKAVLGLYLGVQTVLGLWRISREPWETDAEAAAKGVGAVLFGLVMGGLIAALVNA